MPQSLSALILAAGKGVRMKSDLPKVMHPIFGRPMAHYVVEAVRSVGAEAVHLVVGFGRDHLIRFLKPLGVSFVEQTEQLGTGHAVQCFARAVTQPPKCLLVVCGDTPLLSTETLRAMLDLHHREKPAVTMMTLEMANPGNYGRIIRDKLGNAVAIREAKDCSEAELKIKEVNMAVYFFDGEPLYDHIFKLSNKNRQREFYLTDLVEMLTCEGLKVLTVLERDESSTLGINSRADLAKVTSIVKDRILNEHMAKGVTILDPCQTWIEPGITIGADSIVWPGSVITGSTQIGPRCIVGPNTVIHDSTIGEGVKVPCCHLERAEIPPGTEIRPFSSLTGSHI